MQHQYEALCQRILDKGVMVANERTGVGCLTVVNADFEYHVGFGEFPLVTTRKAPYKAAIAELLGYLRGYSDAQQFADIGSPTWFANANENKAWLANPHRKGENDMGRVYGVQGRSWAKPDGSTIDQLVKVYANLKAGKDDRGEIITFWNPGEFDQGCLRPCLHSYQFSVLDGTLYLNATQRSIDVPLGLVFNMVQVYTFLALMAQITGLKPGVAYHKLVNCHIYENQIELMKEQLTREPFESPRLLVNPEIKSLDDVLTWVSKDDFTVAGYEHHPAISYPFSV
ncbi:thymidylate synthase [Candidatus Saccharibacteria bacterium]|nr:thymidylate synthase [Candidatus Saccharibacteria bacterium]|tara:strand:+ start:44 stop:895 length:852 start_codon:yes stop_codon:yes gene_type:complete